MSLFNILIDIAARTANFESGIKRVEDQLTEFGETVRKSLEFTGISLGVSELIKQFDEFAERAESMSHAAEKTGLAVDELSRLAFAANQTGISTEDLTTGIERFSKTVEQATQTAGEQRAAFAAIGVALTDSNGNLRAQKDLLTDVANRFESYRDGVEKTALAQIIFGRAGADLIPLLNLGADGLKSLSKRAEELGIVISENTAKAAERFNSKLGELHAVGWAFWQLTAEQLLPTLTKVVSAFVDSATGANKFHQQIEPLVIGVKALVDAGTTVSTLFHDIGTAIGASYASSVQLLQGNFKESASIWKEWLSNLEKSHASANEFLQKLWDDTGKKLDDLADPNKHKPPAPLVSAIDMGNQFLELLEQIDRKTREAITGSSDKLANVGLDAVGRINKSLDRLDTSTRHLWDDLDDLSQQGARNIQGAFADFLFDPAKKGFAGLVTDFAHALQRMLAEAAATDLFRALFGADREGNSGLGGILGAFLGGLFGLGGGSGGGGTVPAESTGPVYGGGRASGGPIDAGKWYIAGEHGPEPIWGGGPGAFAMGYGGGGGVVINNNVDARGATVDLIKVLPSILRQNNEQLKGEIITGLQRGKYR